MVESVEELYSNLVSALYRRLRDRIALMGKWTWGDITLEVRSSYVKFKDDMTGGQFLVDKATKVISVSGKTVKWTGDHLVVVQGSRENHNAEFVMDNLLNMIYHLRELEEQAVGVSRCIYDALYNALDEVNRDYDVLRIRFPIENMGQLKYVLKRIGEKCNMVSSRR